MYKSEKEYLTNYIRNGYVNMGVLEGSSFKPKSVVRIQFKKPPSVRSAWETLEDMFCHAETTANDNCSRGIEYDVLGYPPKIGGLPIWDLLLEAPKATRLNLVKSVQRALREDKRIAGSWHIPLPGDGWDQYLDSMAIHIERASEKRSIFTISDSWL